MIRFVRLQAVTPYGKSEPSTDVFAIGVPINPPSVNGFSSYSGGTDCWLYVNGENFFVGQTEVHVGGVLPTSVAVYDSQSIGLTVAIPLAYESRLTVRSRTAANLVPSTQTGPNHPGVREGASHRVRQDSQRPGHFDQDLHRSSE